MADDPIKHVVLLIMENHSFDQMLGCMKEVYVDLDGVDPTHLYSNIDIRGRRYQQKETEELQMRFDPKHDHINVLRQIADNNGGFVRDFATAHRGSKPVDRQEIMGYYPRGSLPALHALAQEFLICDKWFSSVPGPTWPNRFFALSGTSRGVVVMPEGLRDLHPASFLEQIQHTIFDRLHEAGRSWRVYHYDLPSSWILLRQLEPRNLLHYHHAGQFFQDAREGDLPDFTFIEPKYFGKDQNDDHPPHNIMKAEKLIADVYNAIRSSPAVWDSTLFVVFYDEHGGFYDHVPPPATVPPDEHTQHYAFARLGVRVPALLISPWLSAGVSHVTFDHTSLLKYLIDKWSLGPLGERTAQATSIRSALRFETQPRTDTIPFIRVPNSKLYAPCPELEFYDRNPHHTAFDLFSRFLSNQTGQPQVVNDALPTRMIRSWLDWLGKLMMRWGRRIGHHHQSRAQRMAKLADRVKEGSPRS